jgi:hypothetical protein
LSPVQVVWVIAARTVVMPVSVRPRLILLVLASTGTGSGAGGDRPPLFDLGPRTFPVDFSLCPDSKA